MAPSNVAAQPTATAPIPQVSDAVFRDADRYREVFVYADPFKHVVIEDFFEPSFAERLLIDFPSFNPKLAMNEHGQLGGKAVNTKIREISATYKELYETLGSKPFLEFVSRLSGIPDLILDPKLFGGGTHDNQHGQELDAHVDFNYDESQQLHRRLNLIVYMNKEWRGDWGGGLEIHSDPRDPANNRISTYEPLFNRCVMFETNEYSWHGFPKIHLPPEKRHLSRKSISIYLYTKTRPAGEIAPMHGTFYIQRPLPAHISAGRILTAEDEREIRNLLLRRDDWIKSYQRMELDKNRDIAAKNHAIQELMNHIRVPLTGYAVQAGPPTGIYTDDWVSSRAELQIRPLAPVSGIVLRGWRPEGAPKARVSVSVDGGASSETQLTGGSFELTVKLPKPASEPFPVKIVSEADGRFVPESQDNRDLVFMMAELRAQHPAIQTLMKMLG